MEVKVADYKSVLRRPGPSPPVPCTLTVSARSPGCLWAPGLLRGSLRWLLSTWARRPEWGGGPAGTAPGPPTSLLWACRGQWDITGPWSSRQLWAQHVTPSWHPARSAGSPCLPAAPLLHPPEREGCAGEQGPSVPRGGQAGPWGLCAPHLHPPAPGAGPLPLQSVRRGAMRS